MLFAFVFIFYLGMAALPAQLMVSGHETAAGMIYRGFRFMCHQYPWRSWFIGGAQHCYPLAAAGISGLVPFEKAAGVPSAEVSPGSFYGTPEMGYKMAVCQRDVGIYGTMALFSLIFFLSRNRIRCVDRRLWLIAGILPMALDGGWQMVSQLLPGLPVWESTPFLRTLTGALFGLLTCWYLLPTLEKTLRDGEK